MKIRSICLVIVFACVALSVDLYPSGSGDDHVVFAEMLREYQARYEYHVKLNDFDAWDEYVPWPRCIAGTLPPPYPPDDFYEEDFKIKERAAELVSEFRGTIWWTSGYGPRYRIWDLFVRVDDNGDPDIPGNATIETYDVEGDMPWGEETEINKGNYSAAIRDITEFIEDELIFLEVAGGGDTTVSDQYTGTNSDPDYASSCGDAQFNAVTNYQQDASGFHPASMKEGDYSFGDSSAGYEAYLDQTRTEIYADLTDFDGDLAVRGAYAYILIKFREGGLGGHQPPVKDIFDHGLYHDFNAIPEPGTEWKSAQYPTGVPEFTGGCDGKMYGWEGTDFPIVVEPMFETTADKGECCPGACSGGACGPGGSYANPYSGPRFTMNLGNDPHGQHEGYIQWGMRNPSENKVSLGEFYYRVGDEVTVDDSTAGTIEIEAELTTAEIVEIVPDEEIEVRFFHPDNHDTDPGGKFRTYKFEEIQFSEPAAEYLISEFDGNSTEPIRAWVYKWEEIDELDERGGQWRLGEGYDKGTGAALTWKDVSTTWDDDRDKRVRTVMVREDPGSEYGDVIRSREMTIWERQEWGRMKRTERRRYVGGQEYLGTTWDYFDDTAGSSNRHRLRLREDHDGYWEYYEYDNYGRRVLTVSPFENSTPSFDGDGEITNKEDHRIRERIHKKEDINGDNEDDFVVEYIETVLDEVVSRRYEVGFSETFGNGDYVETASIRLHSESAQPNSNLNFGNKNLETRTAYYYEENGNWNGKVRRVIRPDKTATVYEYALIGDDRQTITKRGVLENPTDQNSFNITEGIRTKRLANSYGHTYEEERKDLESQVQLVDRLAPPGANYVNWDAFGRVLKWDYTLDGTSSERSYACCGQVEWEIDREGFKTEYGYDDLKRLTWKTEAAGTGDAVTYAYSYDAAGRRLTTERIPGESPTGSGGIVLEELTYDWAGRMTSRTEPYGDGDAVTTEFDEYESWGGYWEKETEFADNTSRREAFYHDRSPVAIYGTATHMRTFAAGVDLQYGRYMIEYAGGIGSSEWVKRYSDSFGRVHRIEYADGAVETMGYNNLGQMEWTEDPDGVTHYYTYNTLGEREYSALLVSGFTTSGIDDGGSDRISRTVNDYLSPGEGDNPSSEFAVRRSRTFEWPDEGNPTSQLSRTVFSTVPGVRDGQGRWTKAFAMETEQTVELLGDGERIETSIKPNGNYSERHFENGRLQSEVDYTSDDWVMFESNYFKYDGHGRVEKREDSRIGGGGFRVTTFSYYDDDRVETITSPDPDPNQSGPGWEPQETKYEYDERGRKIKETLPDNGVVEFEYRATRELEKTWGTRTYPVKYEYQQGRMTKMTTWEDYDGDSGKSVTEWEYDEQRGWLIEKRYPDGNGPEYDYTDAGRLKERIWAREVAGGGDLVTTYTNSAVTGELTGITYSDNTPDVTYQYNRLGQRDEISDGSGTRELKYTDNGLLHREEYHEWQGVISDIIVEHVYDETTGRLMEINLLDSNETLINSQTYTYYSGNARLWEVSESDYSAEYHYHGGSYVTASATFKRNGSTVEASRQDVDDLNRVTRTYMGDFIFNPILSQDYDYNDANQRTQMTSVGEDEPEWTWEYGYDDLGQVDSAQRKWGSPSSGIGAPVPGQQYSYEFDDIGNRTKVTVNQRDANYVAGTVGLNQYAERNVPDAVDILGLAIYPDTDIYINSEPPDEKEDEYFYHVLNFNNSTEDRYEEVTIEEWDGGVKLDDYSGFHFLAKDPEEFDYDDDGNLIEDGRWEYTWDAENRLIKAKEIRTANIELQDGDVLRKFHYTYDDQGRRVRTEGFYWDTANEYWGLTGDGSHFVYSGWNIIAELDDAILKLRKSYLWGLDIAEQADWRQTNGGQSIGQAAGGVGGLLLVTDHDEDESHFVHSDANGNVVALFDAEGDGTVPSAIYDYDPFGNLIRASGEAADINPFRFSSKYQDRRTGLYYYGFRFYSAGQGRFLNRDPIEERGGLNLYGFVGNDPVNSWDYLGLDFIAVGSRSLQGATGRLPTARHKSIYYFTGCHDLEEGDHLEFSEIPDTVEQEGVFELLGQDRYERKYSGIFGAERTQDITVSVVFDFLSHWSADAEEIVVIWSENNQAAGSTEEAWSTVDSTARNYRYGLHFPNLPSKLDSTNWPHVKYIWNQTNSTTFIRVLARSIERAANPGNVLGRHWGHSFPQAPIDYLLQERGYPERKW